MSRMSEKTTRLTSRMEQKQLEEVLCRALRCQPSELQRVDCDLEQAGAEAGGFMSVCGSMTVNAVVNGHLHKLHLFVKREDAAEVAGSMGVFKKEWAYFERIKPILEKAWRRNQKQDAEALPDLGPSAYLGTDTLTVMEDLTKSGYQALPGGWLWNGLSLDAVQQSLRALARVHAASLVAERLDGARLAEVAPELLQENFLTRRPGAVGRRQFDVAGDTNYEYLLPALFSSLNVPQTAEELRRLQDLSRDAYQLLDMDLLRRTSKSLLVMGHGDAWPNNVLVKYDAEGRVQHAVLVDFQMVRMSPPAFDVMMFLHVSTRRAFRRKHQDSLVRGYYDDLVAFCQQRDLDVRKELSFETFLESVAQTSRVCRAIVVAYWPSLAGSEEDMRAIFSDGDARAKFMLETPPRRAFLERWFTGAGAEGQRYRDIITEAFEELLEIPPSKPAC